MHDYCAERNGDATEREERPIPIARAEVLRAFLHLEAMKGDDYARSLVYDVDDVELIPQVTAYAELRHSSGFGFPPLLAWTTDSLGSSRSGRVDRWLLSRIPLSELYTKGVGPHMESDLRSADWNLAKFADIVVANLGKYPEFDRNWVPSEHRRWAVFGVCHRTRGYDGSIELLDGVHRCVSLLMNSVHSAWAYLAYLRQ